MQIINLYKNKKIKKIEEFMSTRLMKDNFI